MTNTPMREVRTRLELGDIKKIDEIPHSKRIYNIYAQGRITGSRCDQWVFIEQVMGTMKAHRVVKALRGIKSVTATQAQRWDVPTALLAPPSEARQGV